MRSCGESGRRRSAHACLLSGRDRGRIGSRLARYQADDPRTCACGCRVVRLVTQGVVVPSVRTYHLVILYFGIAFRNSATSVVVILVPTTERAVSFPTQPVP